MDQSGQVSHCIEVVWLHVHQGRRREVGIGSCMHTVRDESYDTLHGRQWPYTSITVSTQTKWPTGLHKSRKALFFLSSFFFLLTFSDGKNLPGFQSFFAKSSSAFKRTMRTLRINCEVLVVKSFSLPKCFQNNSRILDQQKLSSSFATTKPRFVFFFTPTVSPAKGCSMCLSSTSPLSVKPPPKIGHKRNLATLQKGPTSPSLFLLQKKKICKTTTWVEDHE